MALLRSGIVLFVSVTTVAATIMWGLFYVADVGFRPDLLESIVPIFHFSAAAFATTVLLLALAWRGRQQPMVDGVFSMNILVLGYSIVQAIFIASAGQSKYPDSAPFFYLFFIVSIYLACLVPAHVICCLALRRTPLLRGLYPPKSKGPAEASP